MDPVKKQIVVAAEAEQSAETGFATEPKLFLTAPLIVVAEEAALNATQQVVTKAATANLCHAGKKVIVVIHVHFAQAEFATHLRNQKNIYAIKLAQTQTEIQMLYQIKFQKRDNII